MSAADLRALAEVCILGAFMAFSVLVLREPLRVHPRHRSPSPWEVGVCVVLKDVRHVLSGPGRRRGREAGAGG